MKSSFSLSSPRQIKVTSLFRAPFSLPSTLQPFGYSISNGPIKFKREVGAVGHTGNHRITKGTKKTEEGLIKVMNLQDRPGMECHSSVYNREASTKVSKGD